MSDKGDENFDVTQLPGRAQQLYDVMQKLRQREQSKPHGSLMQFPRDVDVPHVFDDFVQLPVPGAFKQQTDDLLEAMRQVAGQPFATQTSGADGLANTTLDQVGSAGDELSDWSGLAATAFKRNFADPFPRVSSNQFAVYQVTRQAINAEASVWASARADLDTFSANAIKQMQHVTDCKPGDWKFLFTLLGAVVSGANAVRTAEHALDVAAAGKDMASTGMDLFGEEGSTDDLGLPNGSPAEIIDSLVEQLDKIRAEIRNQEDKINISVNAAFDLLNAQRDDFLLPTPALAGATPGNLADPTEMGYAS